MNNKETIIASAMGRVLESFDWVITRENAICSSNHKTMNRESKFCSTCGEELPNFEDTGLEELYKAFKRGLRVKKDLEHGNTNTRRNTK